MRSIDRIDQVIPSLASRDAIGQHSLNLRDVIRAMGLESDIYFTGASEDRLRQGQPLARLEEQQPNNRVLLYQLSIGSPAGEVFATRPEPKLVNYHNITPAELIDAWEPEIAEQLRWGRAQMSRLAAVTAFAFSDSRFNAAELRTAGYPVSVVSPLLIDLDALAGDPDRRLLRRLGNERAKGGHDLLFVGKVAPHKAQHDLIKAFVVYRRVFDGRARLRIVGGSISPRYSEALERMTHSFGVSDAVEFAGSVSHEELVAYYRSSSVFVCLSDHEGFGVPLIEAMCHGLPIVAFGTAAVPDTLGGAGLILADKEPASVAAAIDLVLRDEALQRSMARAADERVRSLALPSTRAEITAVMSEALETIGDGAS